MSILLNFGKAIPTLKNKLFYYLYALVSLKPSQLFYYLLRRVFDVRKHYRVSDAYEVNSSLSACEFLEWQMEADTDWTFRFLNQSRKFEAGKPDWVSADMPRLWRYNLHYFDFLQDPKLDQSTKELLIINWIEKNPVGTETAWEPYTLSLRLVNWIKYLMCQEKNNKVPSEMIHSLALQAYWLDKNLEKHILANHYFKNIKAMMFAAIYLKGEDSDKWLKTATKELLAQIREQTLDDGGHYERSPMYHSIYLEDLLDLLQIVTVDRVGEELVLQLKNVALKAALFQRDILMPDSRIPLFNDAAFGIAPEPETLLRYASDALSVDMFDASRFPSRQMFDSTGYFILGDEKNRMIVDCGETGPRYQPGHTHCDTLSYELAVDGKTLIVDSGTYDYQPGEKRAFDRSTLAHNTIAVDGFEQSEIWGLFRVARRASPLFAKFTQTVDGAEFSGAHDGYHRLAKAVTHQRDISFTRTKGWSISDSLDGQGVHQIESFIHLHPDVFIDIKGKLLVLKDQEQKSLADVEIEGDVEIEILDSVYHPEFGVEESNKVVRIWCRTEMPVTFGYTIKIASTNN